MNDIIEVKHNRIPSVVKWVFGVLYYLWAIYIAFMSLLLAVTLFKGSIAAGLVLFLTGIGEIIYIFPVGFAFGGLSILDGWTENIESKYEFWIKLILGYIGLIIISYLLILVVGILTGFAIAI